MNNIVVKLSWAEWSFIQKFIRTTEVLVRGKKIVRRRFNTDFSNFLSDKIQLMGVANCRLVTSTNWFRKDDSQRKNSTHYWSGKYSCLDKSCQIKYIGYIEKIIDNTEVNLIIRFDNSLLSTHDLVQQKIKCSGEKRDQQKLELMSNGTLNTLNSNVISNREKPLDGNYWSI